MNQKVHQRWRCIYCDKAFPVPSLNQQHEVRCPSNPGNQEEVSET